MRTKDSWLDPNEAAEYTRVSRVTLNRAVKAGELKGVRVRGRKALRFRCAWLDRWLEDHPRRQKGAE